MHPTPSKAMNHWAWALPAVIMVVGLSCGSGAAATPAQSPSPPAASPSSPPLDAAGQAYLAVIQTDGTAYERAHNAGGAVCNPGASLAQNQGCNSTLNLAVAQTLKKLQTDLGNVGAPSRWAADDHAIRSGLPAAITALQAAAAAYDAKNDAAYRAATASYIEAASPIQQALTDIDPALSFG